MLRTFFFSSPTLLLMCGLAPASIEAHPAIEAQIAIVNERIAKEPANAGLLLRRGQLRQAHREWEAALSDYRRAVELDPGLQAARLRLGETLLEAGRPVDAKRTLDEFLTANPDHADGSVLRGRVLQRLGKLDAAVADYSRAIALSERPQPDWYLERARAVSADDRNLAKAIGGLDDGITRLGPLVTLQTFAIELELRRRGYESALTRVDALLAHAPRQPQWLVKRAELLAHVGRLTEARATYRAALEAIDALPPSRRHAKMVVVLEAQAKHSLAQLAAEDHTVKVADDLPTDEKE